MLTLSVSGPCTPCSPCHCSKRESRENRVLPWTLTHRKRRVKVTRKVCTLSSTMTFPVFFPPSFPPSLLLSILSSLLTSSLSLPGVIQDSSGVVSHSDSQQEGYEVPENFKTLHHLALQYVNQVSKGRMLKSAACYEIRFTMKDMLFELFLPPYFRASQTLQCHCARRLYET